MCAYAVDIIEKSEVVEETLDRIFLDPNNPRFKHIEKKLTDKEIEESIWKESDTQELYNQILAAGGLYEMPVIDHNRIVREGNRRTVCLRVLKRRAAKRELPNIPPSKFDKIKCRLLSKNSDPAFVALFLASIHVKGKKEWNTFNRALYIYDLHNMHHLSYDTIAKHLGMGKITVIRMVDVYKATEEYGRRHTEDKQWYHKFTYFDELYKKRDLKEFRENTVNVIKFGDWVKEEKFHDVRDVRDLPKIVTDNEALEVLERAKIDDARRIVESKDPTIKSPQFKRLKETIEIIRSFSRKELINTLNDASRLALLKTLKTEVESLLKDLDTMKKTAGGSVSA
jgi:hypothetical protein